MQKKELWVGLISFCAGIVLIFNLSNMYLEETAGLAVTMIVEIIVLMLLFGGLLMMYLGARSDKAQKQTKDSRARNPAIKRDVWTLSGCT